MEDPAIPHQRGPLAGEGHVRGLTVPVGDRTAQLPHQVVAGMEGVLDELVAGHGGTVNEHLPYRATWDPASRTMTLHYPDGLRAQVLHEVDASLRPGHPEVRVPDGVRTADGWHQDGLAVVALPADLPVDAALHLDTVRRELTGAWRLLHQELGGALTGEAPRVEEPAGPPPPPPGPPVGTLHVLGFDVGTRLPQGGFLGKLATGMGGIGDQVALRMPDTASGELAPGVKILGVQALPGITGPISSLLRPDGLPGDVDVIVGYGQTAGIADVRLDAYPDAKVVQVLDALPTDPKHLAVLARADLVVAVGPDLAAGVRTALDRLGLAHVPEVREIPPAFEAKPTPPPRPPAGPYRLLVYGGDPVAMDHAASVVSELHARGVTDVRLTVAPYKTDPTILAAMRGRLAGLAGADVEVVPLPKGEELTARLHDADLVLVPTSGPGFDEAFVAAAEHGVPVLVDGRTSMGRFLAGDNGVPEHLADPAVVGRLGDTPSVHAWADRVQGALSDLGGERIRALGLREHLTSRYEPADSARGLHDALRSVGGRVARVDEAAWHRELDPREVVLRPGRTVEAPTDGRLRVMTTCTEWRSKLGGVPTANRELTEAFGAAGAEVYGRVSTVDFENRATTHLEPGANVHVLGVPEVWGVLDGKGFPDTRAMIMLLDNLPPHVDVVVGHSRFSGGAATWLVDHVYPDAKYVHVLHTSPEILDALRGDRQEGLDHAKTERLLMARADLVSGVGPLLAREAARLNLEAAPLRLEARPGDPPPPVHEIISDMPANPVDPPGRPPDRVGYELMIQGRAGDAIKGVEFAARLVAKLRAQGIEVRLTVRGAPDEKAVLTQTRDLSEIAGCPVVVKEFTTDKAELLADLHHADLVLMPSIHEGFGLVASEAGRAGVPVLVGEGTGAGMFFGNPRYLPRDLGGAATIRDGVTVDMLHEALRAVIAPDGTLTKAMVESAVTRVNELRMTAWVDHVKATLGDLAAQQQRALDMRGFLDHKYPLGNAGRMLLEAISGEHHGAEAPIESGGHAEAATAERAPPGATLRAAHPEPAPASGDIGAVLRGQAGSEPPRVHGETAPHEPPHAGPEATHGGQQSTHGDNDVLHHQQPGGSGPRLPMELPQVHDIAARYGVDLQGLKIVLRKDRVGYEGSTGPDGTISLTRDAFRNEEQLARTLAHERYHVEQIRSGMPYPKTKAEAVSWERDAYAYEQRWWDSHPLNPANRSKP